MLERFTDNARRALAVANQHAVRSGAASTSDVDILLGIIDTSHGVGAIALRELAIDISRLKDQLEQLPRQLSDGPAPSNDGPVPRRLPLTPEVKLALESAIAVSQQLRHSSVGTQHLLLGLLLYPEFASVRVLSEHGISLERAMQASLDAMKTHDGSNDDP
jgi:ATP-dependent Clp protease ATP-binding subunit ClpC